VSPLATPCSLASGRIPASPKLAPPLGNQSPAAPHRSSSGSLRMLTLRKPFAVGRLRRDASRRRITTKASILVQVSAIGVRCALLMPRAGPRRATSPCGYTWFCFRLFAIGPISRSGVVRTGAVLTACLKDCRHTVSTGQFRQLTSAARAV
jgi:hypothetical protein